MNGQRKGTFAKLIMVTQLGISLIAPVLLCVFLSVWIQKRFQTGYWVVVVGIVLGIASMINTFYRFYKDQTDENNKKPPGFNRHE